MRLTVLSLNMWGGRAPQSPMEFVNAQAKEVDVFCLQETVVNQSGEHKELIEDWNGAKISSNMLAELAPALETHIALFVPLCIDVHNVKNSHYGLTMLVRRELRVAATGAEYFQGSPSVFNPTMGLPDEDHARALQWVTLRSSDTSSISIINLHGIWRPGNQGKADTPERIAQSEAVLAAAASLGDQVIIAGDFNLLPDTTSLQMIRNSGFVDHHALAGMPNTRTSLYTKELPYADYIFTSPKLRAEGFEVLPDVVSDHSPLKIHVTTP